jgi:hypothetical protein
LVIPLDTSDSQQEQALTDHAGKRAWWPTAVGRLRQLPAEHLLQEIGGPGGGVGPDLLFLLPQHIKQAIEALTHDITIEIKGFALEEGDGLRASQKICLAAGAARSAARFILKINSSTWAP